MQDETEALLEETDSTSKSRTDALAKSRLVALNVGGEKMITSQATLAMAPAGSLLARMFGPDADPTWAPPQLADGSYFLDLNPRHFAVVLDVLRHGPAALQLSLPADRACVALVADYLGLDSSIHPSIAGNVLRYRAAIAPEPSRMTILAVSTLAFQPNHIDLCEWDAGWIKATYVPAICSWTLAEVRDVLSATLDIPASRMVAHLCLHRRNGTTRPDAHLPMESTIIQLDDVHAFAYRPLVLLVHESTFVAGMDALPLSTLRQKPPAISTSPLSSSLSSQPRNSRRSNSLETMTQPPDGAVLIFVKCFDRTKESLTKARPLIVNPKDMIAAAVPAMCGLLELSGGQHVHLFEEVSAYVVTEVDPAKTFSDAEIAYGDILWLESADGRTDPSVQLAVDVAIIDRIVKSPPLHSRSS